MPTKEYASELMQKCTMEAVGTAILCFTVGATVGQSQALAGVSIGSVLMCIVYFGGHISGGQYNPAVALSIFLRGKMNLIELGAYATSQIAGGFIGGLLAWAVVPSGIGYPSPGAMVGIGSALVGEIVQTFALCHVILHVATTSAQQNNSYYGLAIGFTVLAGANSVGPYSGGAFNPAVGIALPLIAGEARYFWIYIVGPLLGGALASLIFAFTHSNELPGTGPLQGIKHKFKDSETRKLASPIIMEFIGTGLLAFTIATAAGNGNPLAALAIGSTLMCQVYTAGSSSGGQLNPAVTIGIQVRKMLASWSVDSAGQQLKSEFTNVKTIAYIVAQCVGALIFGLLGRVVAASIVTGAGAPIPPSTGNLGSQFVAEVIATFLLVFVVLQAATSSKTTDNDFFGLAIGFVVVSMAVAVGGVSGGALNPAVGLLAIVTKTGASVSVSYARIWIYWVACPLGGVLAALLFRVTNAPEFLKAEDDAKTERAVEKNNTVFADKTEGPKQTNAFFKKEGEKVTMTKDAAADKV